MAGSELDRRVDTRPAHHRVFSRMYDKRRVIGAAAAAVLAVSVVPDIRNRDDQSFQIAGQAISATKDSSSADRTIALLPSESNTPTTPPSDSTEQEQPEGSPLPIPSAPSAPEPPPPPDQKPDVSRIIKNRWATIQTGTTHPTLIAMIGSSIVPHRVTSTTGGSHERTSYHYQRKAADFAEPQVGTYDTPGMLKINLYFAQYANGLRELIYSGPGGKCVKDMKIVTCSDVYNAKILANHHNHVHVAADATSLANLK